MTNDLTNDKIAEILEAEDVKSAAPTLRFKTGGTYMDVASNDVLEIDGISHFNSSQLGLQLVILPTGEIVDVASPVAYLIDIDRLEECEQNIIDWMDQGDTKSAEDFRGEAATDWDWIVRAVRNSTA